MEEDLVGRIEPIALETEMGEAYLDYAMSTIVSRAIPDVRDGLKPVQRRILYAMQDLGARSNSQFRKCARIVGETMGKYHPHGEAAIYDGLARMAQPFSLRYMPVEGQGNFGSVDGDPPAAMRYTEARLSRLAEEMLADIDRDTVDFVENFDSSAEEPLVLPAKAPNLLINGASGIAVGMATNIPPNNFREIADAVNALLENPDLSGDELSKIVLGPDFPTGAMISAEGIRSAYGTGRGRILVRALVNPEESREGRNLLVVSELPYQVNKAKLTEKIATLVRSKTIEGISDIRDESDREGMRLVVELRRDAYPTKVLNQLYKHTALQTTFGVNMVTLVDGQPRTVSLREALQEFIKHREEVVTRRARFDLLRALDRAHVLEGFLTALDNIDEVVAIIRASETTDDARAALMERFDLSEIQANAILDMQLRRLVALEAQKLRDELTELRKRIAELEALLADVSIVHGVIREETLELRERFGDARRTQIGNITGELTDEDLIPDEDCVVTITRRGYAKRQPTGNFRTQGRGGKGIRGLAVKDDEIQHFLVTNSHDHILAFTNRGRAFKLRCYELPRMSREARGVAMVNLLALERRERVMAPIAFPNFEAGENLLMGTLLGEVKRTALTQYATVRTNGLLAMRLKIPKDELGWVRLSDGQSGVMFVTRNGTANHFHEDGVRRSGRTSGGVRGIRLRENDQVVAMDLTRDGSYLLVVTNKGYGKKMPLKEFLVKGRGGFGVKAINLSEKTGYVVAARVLSDPDEDILLLSTTGRLIRLSLGEVRPLSRLAAGMILMRMNEGEEVAGLAVSGDGRETVGSENGSAAG
ncbi:MAG: DNA gyrase subunit A [Chloroflexi bacterium]|nr:DNA gyrase subunit A [Chloroflexota bacterium]MCY3939419.1 DNA gyrase subunit A [Chloroflexota bacterium]